MSIATQLSRIQADRNTIRAKLVELGMATSVDNLTKLAAAIESIINQGAVSVEVKEGESYTIPKGYHNGSGVVLGVSGGGNYLLQEKAVTPTKKEQNITAGDGYYGLSAVTVSPIPDIYQDVSSVTAKAEEVITGKIFVSSSGEVITGTMANNGNVAKVLDGTTITYVIPKGYHSGSGTVSIVLETKTVVPTKKAQDVTPTEGKVLNKVTVAPIPDEYITTDDADATAAYILDGKTAYVKGAKVTGSMANLGSATMSFDGITKTEIEVGAGYTSGGKISLTTDIEEALAAI